VGGNEEKTYLGSSVNKDMTSHRSVTLLYRTDKAGNVYRYIEEWEAVPSSHGPEIFYLLLYGLFQWGVDRDTPVRAFSIVMQYSTKIGKNVDISQPAHIHEKDMKTVMEAFSAFASRCKQIGR
jgi:hypothetical protein